MDRHPVLMQSIETEYSSSRSVWPNGGVLPLIIYGLIPKFNQCSHQSVVTVHQVYLAYKLLVKETKNAEI